jgi:hypothetical protein
MWKIPPVSQGRGSAFFVGSEIWDLLASIWECFIAKSMIFIKLPNFQIFIYKVQIGSQRIL